ncbi:unnamed protein product [Ectocarpus fasciculatus]
MEHGGVVNSNVMHVISDMDTLLQAHRLLTNSTSKKMGTYELSRRKQKELEQLQKDLTSGKFKYIAALDYTAHQGRKLKPSEPDGVIPETDLVVRQALQLVLSAVFEPAFCRHSHGFRPDKGFHSCLREIKEEFTDTHWFLKGELPGFIETVQHDILVDIIKRKVQCDKTITLLKRTLKMPYFLDAFGIRKWVAPRSGIQKLQSLGKLFCNIYLNELDKFISQYKSGFDKQVPLDHVAADVAIAKKKKEGPTDSSLPTRILSWSLVQNESKALHYVRFGDEFFIGVNGSFLDAKDIREQITCFLKAQLQLSIDGDVLEPQSAKKKTVLFLGTEIEGYFHKKLVGGKMMRVRMSPKLNLMVPMRNLIKNTENLGFMRQGHPCSYKKIVNWSHEDILRYFNRVIIVTLNYYSFAENRTRLGSYVSHLKYSCAQTLAIKYKLSSQRKVFKKYGSVLKCPTTNATLYRPDGLPRIGKFLENPPPPPGMIPPNLL